MLWVQLFPVTLFQIIYMYCIVMYDYFNVWVSTTRIWVEKSTKTILTIFVRSTTFISTFFAEKIGQFQFKYSSNVNILCTFSETSETFSRKFSKNIFCLVQNAGHSFICKPIGRYIVLFKVLIDNSSSLKKRYKNSKVRDIQYHKSMYCIFGTSSGR